MAGCKRVVGVVDEDIEVTPYGEKVDVDTYVIPKW